MTQVGEVLPYEEEWRDIIGTDGTYQVSNFGNVRSLLKPGNHRNRLGNPRLLKLRNNGKGYLNVSLPLKEDGSYITKSVHGLVARAFLGEKPERTEIAHLNGDPSDNRVLNLQYVTHKENEAHKKLHGTVSTGERNGQSKFVGWQVELMKYLASKGIPQKKIGDLFDTSHKTISGIIVGTTWDHINPHKDMQTLTAENERLRKALEFYAKHGNYEPWRESDEDRTDAFNFVDLDGGNTAREALRIGEESNAL